jgi:hypothetical protein
MNSEMEQTIRVHLDLLREQLNTGRRRSAIVESASDSSLEEKVTQTLARVVLQSQLSPTLVNAVICCFTECLLTETPAPGWLTLFCNWSTITAQEKSNVSASLRFLQGLIDALESHQDLRAASSMTFMFQVLKMRLAQLYTALMDWYQAKCLTDAVFASRRHSLGQWHLPFSSAEHEVNPPTTVDISSFDERSIPRVRALWADINDPYRLQIIRSLLCLNLQEEQLEHGVNSAETRGQTSWLQLAESQLAQGRNEDISKFAMTLADLVIMRPRASTWDCIQYQTSSRVLEPYTWSDTVFLLAQNLCQGRIAEAKGQYTRAARDYNAVLWGLDLVCNVAPGSSDRSIPSWPPYEQARPVATQASQSTTNVSFEVASAPLPSAPPMSPLDQAYLSPNPRTTANLAAVFFACTFRRAFCATILSPVGVQRDQMLLALHERAARYDAPSQASFDPERSDQEPSCLRIPRALIRHLIARRTIRQPLGTLARSGESEPERDLPAWFRDYCYVATEYLLPHQRDRTFYQAILEHNIYTLAQYCDALHLADLLQLAKAPYPMLQGCEVTSDHRGRPSAELGGMPATAAAIDLEQVLAHMIHERSFAVPSICYGCGIPRPSGITTTPYIDQALGIVRFRESDKRRILAVLSEKGMLSGDTCSSASQSETETKDSETALTNDLLHWKRGRDSASFERMPDDVEIAFLCRELDLLRRTGPSFIDPNARALNDPPRLP